MPGTNQTPNHDHATAERYNNASPPSYFPRYDPKFFHDIDIVKASKEELEGLVVMFEKVDIEPLQRKLNALYQQVADSSTKPSCTAMQVAELKMHDADLEYHLVLMESFELRMQMVKDSLQGCLNGGSCQAKLNQDYEDLEAEMASCRKLARKLNVRSRQYNIQRQTDEKRQFESKKARMAMAANVLQREFQRQRGAQQIAMESKKIDESFPNMEPKLLRASAALCLQYQMTHKDGVMAVRHAQAMNAEIKTVEDANRFACEGHEKQALIHSVRQMYASTNFRCDLSASLECLQSAIRATRI